MSEPRIVTAIPISTVFFLPHVLILMPTGTLKKRNHTNTMDGMNPAIVSLHPNADLA